MQRIPIQFLLVVALSFLQVTAGADAGIDIGSIEPDLVVPELSVGDPAAGLRVTQTHPEYLESDVYHVIYLPKDWEAGKRYPVIVEYAGNGPYKNKFGDVSSGKVEGSRLGYGLSGGRDFIWICLPYLNADADANVSQWWGDPPNHDPAATIGYCKKAVPWICEAYGGDPERVLLCGFSRGAIACNYLGLHDDEIAKLWCAFVPFSHYDGVRSWPYLKSDRASAAERLARLAGRPQLILSEGDGGGATKLYLEGAAIDLAKVKIMGTGFRNHSDAWILRPSPARKAVRKWLQGVIAR
ncbi:MAG: hypothetical protein ACI9MB_004770 [Verrucomicrobiales bacterium]|jgi:hypothetical protein